MSILVASLDNENSSWSNLFPSRAYPVEMAAKKENNGVASMKCISIYLS